MRTFVKIDQKDTNNILVVERLRSFLDGILLGTSTDILAMEEFLFSQGGMSSFLQKLGETFFKRPMPFERAVMELTVGF
ncbi:MAG: hypothetical protein ACFFAS_03715 [Promethearchaeota archaeon]